MLNRVCVIGRMTKDPELRRTQNGTPVASFNLACNRTVKTNDGQDADFIPCVIWNKGAENVERYCSKGSLVGVEGRLRSRSYDNSSGQKVFVLEVVCDSVQFLDAKKETQNQNQTTQNQNQYNDPFVNSFNQETSFDIHDDDIQF